MKNFLFLFLFLVNNSFAKRVKTISTERPGQSINAQTVGKNTLQLQSGLTRFEFEGKDNLNFNNVIRYGVLKTTELRIVVDADDAEVNDLSFGFKQLIFEDHKKIIQSLGIALEIEATQSLTLTSSFLDHYTINYIANINDWNLLSTERFTVNYAKSINQQWSWFIEPYFDKTDSRIESNINYGLGYLHSKNLLFDFSVGHDLDTRDSQFISVGLSTRND
jgi:hypothetical protein